MNKVEQALQEKDPVARAFGSESNLELMMGQPWGDPALLFEDEAIAEREQALRLADDAFFKRQLEKVRIASFSNRAIKVETGSLRIEDTLFERQLRNIEPAPFLYLDDYARSYDKRWAHMEYAGTLKAEFMIPGTATVPGVRVKGAIAPQAPQIMIATHLYACKDPCCPRRVPRASAENCYTCGRRMESVA